MLKSLRIPPSHDSFGFTTRDEYTMRMRHEVSAEQARRFVLDVLDRIESTSYGQEARLAAAGKELMHVLNARYHEIEHTLQSAQDDVFTWRRFAADLEKGPNIVILSDSRFKEAEAWCKENIKQPHHVAQDRGKYVFMFSTTEEAALFKLFWV